MSFSSRRSFLHSAAGGLLLAAPRTVWGAPANSAITVGVIGYGNRGGYVTNNCFAKNEYARIAAVCDLSAERRNAATEKFSGAKTFENYHDLLASDVDAVYIATPVYLHPEHFEAAVKARKHIFMEKPAGADAKGCLRVMAAAQSADKTKRISVDFQQRYGADYRKAYALVKSGELGPIRSVRAAWIGNGPKIKANLPPEQMKAANWYFYKEFSGDMIVEQDCHNLDVVNWFMGAHPVAAAGYGIKRTDIGNVLESLTASFKFADGTIFNYQASQKQNGGFRDISETFMCENGSVTTSRTGYTVYRTDQKPEIFETKYDITLDAVNDFLDGARTGRLENMGQAAAESTLVAIMAREAIYNGHEMTWEQTLRG